MFFFSVIVYYDKRYQFMINLLCCEVCWMEQLLKLKVHWINTPWSPMYKFIALGHSQSPELIWSRILYVLESGCPGLSCGQAAAACRFVPVGTAGAWLLRVFWARWFHSCSVHSKTQSPNVEGKFKFVNPMIPIFSLTQVLQNAVC